MADISCSVSMRVEKGYLSSLTNVNGATATMGSDGMQSMTYALGTAAASISTASLSTVGMAFLRNLSGSTASTAQIGIQAGGSFVPFTTLRAGEPALFRMSDGVSYSAIGTPGTRLRVDITEG